jgi:hypothetical protein
MTRDVALPRGHRARAFDPPLRLLDDAHQSTRSRIVAVSDAAFGTATDGLWRDKFTPEFLRALRRFYLLTDPDGTLVGWSGYRARTIRGERVVYFTSTGLVPRCQGMGLVPALQQAVVAREARRHPFQPITVAVRTRNPHSYRLAQQTFGDRPITPAIDGTVTRSRGEMAVDIARWLGFAVDPDTAVARDAYDVGHPIYGNTPRSNDPAVNALFDTLYERDALLVLGGHTRTRALRLAFRHDPSAAVAPAGGQGMCKPETLRAITSR